MLDTNGNIAQSTYLGGITTDATVISLDGFGNVFVGGTTNNFASPGLVINQLDPVAQDTMFLTSFIAHDIVSTGYQYSDLFGGGIAGAPAADGVNNMFIDKTNRIYIVGFTDSTTAFTVANPWETVAVPAVAQESTPYVALPPGGTTGFVLQFTENTTVNGGDAIITYGSYIDSGNTAGPGVNSNTSDVFVTTANAVAGNPAASSVANVYLTGTAATGTVFTSSPFGSPPLGFNQVFGGGGTEAYVLEIQIGLASVVANSVPIMGTYIGIGSVGAGEVGGNVVVDSQGNIYVTGEVTSDEPASVYFDTNPVEPYPAVPNFVANPFLVVFNPTASTILLGTMIGGNNGDTNEIDSYDLGLMYFGGRTLVVDPSGTIWVAGWGQNNNLLNFQATVQQSGGSSTVFVGNTANIEYKFITKIDAVANQSLGQDFAEPNDTSDLAFNLDNFQTTNFRGQIAWGPFPNLTTALHQNGPVGDGLNYSGLFDYDWYQILPPVTGQMTVSISNISIFASGPNATADNGGDLDLYVYQVINNFLYLLGSSTLVNSPAQFTNVNVTAGADILIDVNPYNYTQASYTMNINMVT